MNLVLEPSPSLQTPKCLCGVSLKITVLPKATSLQLEFEAKKMKITGEGLWRSFCLGSKAGKSRNLARKLTLRFFSLLWLTSIAAKFQTWEFQPSRPSTNWMQQDYQERSSEPDRQSCIWNLVFCSQPYTKNMQPLKRKTRAKPVTPQHSTADSSEGRVSQQIRGPGPRRSAWRHSSAAGLLLSPAPGRSSHLCDAPRAVLAQMLNWIRELLQLNTSLLIFQKLSTVVIKWEIMGSSGTPEIG